MFVHAVYFWLKPGLTAEQLKTFEAGVRSLITIPGVRLGHVGKPAPTNRPVIERSYSTSLVVSFDDEAAQDVYQVHPIHDRFRDTCAGLWSRVTIFDSIG